MKQCLMKVFREVAVMVLALVLTLVLTMLAAVSGKAAAAEVVGANRPMDSALQQVTITVTDDPVTGLKLVKLTSTRPGPITTKVSAFDMTPGVVAILINKDGTTELLRKSVAVEDGVILTVPNGATVVLLNKAKFFTDVPSGHWANGAVQFVSAREMFAGTSATTFSPEAPMTGLMVVTALARYDGIDTSKGVTWYAKGVEWAVKKGISDGINLNVNISREELVTMMWRYAGSPRSRLDLSRYSDVNQISSYAIEAARWAVEKGVVRGYGNNTLNPKGSVTRAEVAQIFRNFITVQATSA